MALIAQQREILSRGQHGHDAVSDAETKHQAMAQGIEMQMKKIKKDAEESKLTEIQRLTKQIKQNSGQQEKELIEKLEKYKKNNKSVHFRTQSRDKWNEVFQSKTNPPAVGHYHPKPQNVIGSGRETKFPLEPFNSQEAQRKIRERNKKSKICQHVIKVIKEEKIVPLDFKARSQL